MPFFNIYPGPQPTCISHSSANLMERGNQSKVTDFELLGFSDPPEHQPFLFVLFLMIYTLILLGNLMIFCVVRIDPQLHTPMYFFLSCLALVDIFFTSVTVPKLLINLLSESKKISFEGCITQLYVFVALGNMDSLILAMMAYDRYVAICRPLHYSMIMKKRLRIQMLVGAGVLVSLHSLLHSIMTSRLSFCGANKMHHFFCDVPPLINLACSDTSLNVLLLLTETSIVLLFHFLCIVFSYIRIIFAILKMQSREGRRKAFSTCSSHLVVVALQYGPLLFTYIRPSSAYSPNRDNIITVLHTVVAPMLNPFVYTVRNKEMKGALRRAASRIICSCQK
ncbi:olfactory receptor 1361-like [Rhinatrema bivittatum]|uniref:olfactory receptor 1361-like n=1 Tax=Rhinatrema bivittatum TaxID=194408 RepID=UPI00112AF329|nr:olfactory receptor 1361-like [Rhinatrema bivittatum]